MNKWNSLPLEVGNLLNPAFLGFLNYRIAKSFKDATDTSISADILLVLLTMLLSEDVRSRLPNSIANKYISWINENPDVPIYIYKSLASLHGVLKMGLLYGFNHDIYNINNHLEIEVHKTVKLPRGGIGASLELEDILKRADFIGRWVGMVDRNTLISTLRFTIH